LRIRPIRKTRIYSEVVDEIREMIASGTLQPGDKLPPERELAESFAVSRPTIREAMTVLETAGVVDIYPGKGIFVREKISPTLLEPLATILLLERDSTLELLEVREVLETKAAALAAVRATDEERHELKQCCTEMALALADGDPATEVDIKFHYLIAKATQNAVMMKIMNSLTELFGLSIAEYRKTTFFRKQRPQELLADHRSIVEAIINGDPKGAERAMRQHFRSLELSLWEERKSGGKQHERKVE
jgi:GntR family transcriptional repressor for pyruvate dehydrogenase complex